jgi:hypothetical protein
MTSEDIIENKEIILESAKAFREDANNLMIELSKDFNFSLEATEMFIREVYSHKYNNKGIFRNEWTYYFHGAECRFDNINTGQIVEMIILTKPEFGFLDGYFFYNYMASTERFRELAAWFENHKNVWEAIKILADEKVLTRVASVEINRNIIAY